MTPLIAICLVLGICIFLLGALFWHSLYVNRAQVITIEQLTEKYQELLDQRPTMNIGDRVDSTNKLFDLIDAMIGLEIINTRKYELFLNNKTKNLDYDNVFTAVANNVFKSISPNVFTDRDNVVTKEYLMTYIQKRTLIQYLIYFKKYNSEGGSK